MSSIADKAARAAMNNAEQRSSQHAHSTSLKAIPYEQASTGTPPLPITTAATTLPKAPTSPSLRSEAAIRPTTAPAARSSPFRDDSIKRDSAFSSSPLSQKFAHQPPPTPKVPDIPADVRPKSKAGSVARQSRSSAADEEPRRPRTAFTRSRSRKNTRQKPRSVSPPSFKRLSSFKGLQTDIPTGDMGDLEAGNFGFSHRGSILFGGKKMDDLLNSGVNGDQEQSKAVATPALKVEPPHDANGEIGQAVSPVIDSPRSGLTAGRRKPSIQMLQAAIEKGRVLSAEEITFSMKVRSMYEAGSEDGVDWSVPAISNSNGKDTPDTFQTEETKDEQDEVSELNVSKTRETQTSPSRRSQDVRASYHIKQGHELAGGIEDWQDVNGADIDRYGFIVPNSGERPSSVIGSPPGEGLHRVATGLRLAADQPRRRGLRRSPSSARVSKSVPPGGSMRPGSINSAASGVSTASRSRRSTFRSKDHRITAIAGDMLTHPPGLADISEDQDDGQILSAMKKREWSRNEKWQRMARPVLSSTPGRGGGMQFEFDVSDPKVINRTWKGIPDRWRATAWHSFLTSSARRRGKFVSDESLIEEFGRLQELNCADDYQIDVDVPRTISMHIMFRRRYRGGQRLLFRVLHAISLHSPQTGYVQGMASLAATLLCYFDEERTFVMLVRLWQLRGLEQLFSHGFEGLMTALKQLEDNWLAGSDVAQKLNELNIASTSYGTRWYLTLFNMSIPFPAQLRVWDVFMLLGDASPNGSGPFGGADLDVLHSTSAALVDATREIILDSDFENAMKVLTSFVPIRDEDLLMRVARAEWKMGKKRHDRNGNVNTVVVKKDGP